MVNFNSKSYKAWACSLWESISHHYTQSHESITLSGLLGYLSQRYGQWPTWLMGTPHHCGTLWHRGEALICPHCDAVSSPFRCCFLGHCLQTRTPGLWITDPFERNLREREEDRARASDKHTARFVNRQTIWPPTVWDKESLTWVMRCDIKYSLRYNKDLKKHYFGQSSLFMNYSVSTSATPPASWASSSSVTAQPTEA